MKKKIGILVYDISLVGGAERVALNLARELSDKYEVYLMSLFNEKNTKLDNNYSFYLVSEKTKKIPYHLIGTSIKVRRYIKQNKIDILLSITAGVNSIALLSTFGLKTKVVYCEHSNLENKTYGKKHQISQLIGAKFADKVVTLTERDCNNFIKSFNLPSEKVLAIPNWTNCTTVSCEYDSSSKKIITVGRLASVKGYNLLVDVAKEVYKEHKDWHWDIYGDGSYRSKINDWIKENKLESFICLKGNVNDLYKSNIYCEYSFYVMTSYYEGFPLTLLEAQASKLPIVSFDCPTGPSEIIIDGVNGFLIPTYDVKKMAKQINKLIDNEKIRVEFSKNSQKKINNYSKKSVLKLWDNLINSL